MLLLQLIYPLALLLCLATGMLQLIIQPSILRHYASREAIVLGAALLVFLAGVLSFAWLELYFVGSGSVPLIREVFLSTVLMLLVCVVTWPGAKEADLSAVERWSKRSCLAVLALTAGAFAWSLGYFQVIGWLVDFRELEDGVVEAFLAGSWYAFTMMCFVALTAAITEEVIFRGYLQGRLEGSFLGPWGAAILVAGLFALGHGNYVEPWGLKELQVFILGLVFAFAKLKYGLLAAVLVHLGHNGISLAVQAILLTF